MDKIDLSKRNLVLNICRNLLGSAYSKCMIKHGWDAHIVRAWKSIKDPSVDHFLIVSAKGGFRLEVEPGNESPYVWAMAHYLLSHNLPDNVLKSNSASRAKPKGFAASKSDLESLSGNNLYIRREMAVSGLSTPEEIKAAVSKLVLPTEPGEVRTLNGYGITFKVVSFNTCILANNKLLVRINMVADTGIFGITAQQMVTCKDKVKHTTEAGARAAEDDHNMKFLRMPDFQFVSRYKCPVCDNWHLTSMSKREQKRRFGDSKLKTA